MSDLITDAKDERLNINILSYWDKQTFRDSLRAALQRLADYEKRIPYKCPTCEAWYPTQSTHEAEAVRLYDEELKSVNDLLFRCREDLRKLKQRHSDVEGMAKTIEEEQARFPFPAVFSENIARALCAYLKEEKP